MTVETIAHFAIYISGDRNKDVILQQIRDDNFLRDHINLDTLKGELYSVIRLKELMDER